MSMLHDDLIHRCQVCGTYLWGADKTRRERDHACEGAVEPVGVEATEHGWVIRRTDDYVVEVWRMAFNWRLVVGRPWGPGTVDRGFCYFGTGATVALRAIGAGLAWEDPYNTLPEGFDKRAFG